MSTNTLTPINLEGYVIRNKHTGLYMKKGSTVNSYSKYPQVFSKMRFLTSSLTNKIKYNDSDLQWTLDIEIIDLQGNIIDLPIVQKAIEHLESEYEWKSISVHSYWNSSTHLERIQEQIKLLKGGNTNE